MIARIWHGRTKRENAAEYLQFLRDRAIPDYRAIPGNISAMVMQRHDGDVTHFITFSLWESFDAIRAFAGADVEQARYYDEDNDFLLELEPHVIHYDAWDA